MLRHVKSAVVQRTTVTPLGSPSNVGFKILPIYFKNFSVLNRPPAQYEGHIPLTGLEKLSLGVGSAMGAYLNPRRGDLVASLGEVTASPFVESLRDAMLSDKTGRRILRDRPRITSKNMPIEDLRKLPENTVGRCIGHWLDQHGMSPDDRDSVKYIDDEECAYVMQRYRECHDIYHSVLGIPGAFVEGEVALKAFEFMNTKLPMTGLSLFAVTRLKPEESRRFFNIYLPWAVKNGLDSLPIINIYWEEELTTDVNTLLSRLEIEKPPDLRDIRQKEKLRKKAEKDAR